jgi:[ribosomal protein S5]-alanine N-acetyltransferase
MRYTRGPSIFEHVAATCWARMPTRKVGYGPWVVLEKARGVIIGFGGLYDDPFDVGWGIEVSYHFAVTAGQRLRYGAN